MVIDDMHMYVTCSWQHSLLERTDFEIRQTWNSDRLSYIIGYLDVLGALTLMSTETYLKMEINSHIKESCWQLSIEEIIYVDFPVYNRHKVGINFSSTYDTTFLF